MHLRLQDFKIVSEYNSALFKISSQLKLCGEKIIEEDMLEKTFTTFHASNVLLQQQYRERRFTKYSELISCLLVTEQNNELLMRNHQSHPTRSEPFPEVNAISSQTRGRGQGRGHGRGRNPRYHGSYSNNSQKMKALLHHQKWNNIETKQENGKRLQDKPPKNHKNNCYICGMKEHWSRTCRMPKHLADLYQASIKTKEKEIEMNFIDGDGLDLTYYDIDFFGDCATTHTILRDKRYFLELTLIKVNKFNDLKVFVLWHNRLGHPRSLMMCRIIEHSHGINIEHPVAHTHTQNGLAESFIKLLVCIRPTTYHEYSPSQLVLGKQPNISHLRIFGCTAYVPIAPTQRTKMGPQRRLEIYVGFDSPSIIRYLEPLTDDVFIARFADCHFNESVFLSLGGEKSILEEQREISWKVSTMTHLDPRKNQCELKVQMIIHLQNLANQLPDAFIDTKKVTKSHIPVANTPSRIDVPVGQLTNQSKIRLKRGRPIGSNDVTPRKRRTQEKLGTLKEAIKMTNQFKIDKSIALEEAHIEREAHEEAQVPENYRNNIVINNIFAFQVAYDIIRNDEDPEPRNVEECRHRNDWLKWKERNENNEIIRYKAYVNNPICPCIFIKKSETGFAIIAVYVDDLNLVRTPKELTRTTNYLKKEFEMKDLGKTKFFLVHQSTYIKKVLKHFYMDKAHPLSSPMVVRSFDVKNDSFHHCEKNEELLGPKVPYLSAIGALMYLANCTHPDIAFSYLSDPHKGRSQTRYVFNCNGTAISWRSIKQTMMVTLSNHSEILAIHEASRECIWLRSMIQHIRESCGLSSIKGNPTILFEDNAACITQITGGYIKGDKIKHISPKFFYTHELQKSGEIDVQQICSSDNLVDLFTKSLSTSTFKKLIHKIGMRQLKDIDMRRSMLVKGC
ncbi:hypothetical protein AAG906_006937 [Vitis piasezkii]